MSWNLVGDVERFGITPDGHSSRFATVLGESYYYAKLRINSLESDVERLTRENAELHARITDLNHDNAVLSLKARAVDRLPLCPDHRDKVAGKG